MDMSLQRLHKLVHMEKTTTDTTLHGIPVSNSTSIKFG
jgi:hypothetical protein